MKKASLLFIALLWFQLASSQSNELNAYEYVIVPMQFDFQDEPNEYQLNILSRVLLKEEGFKVYMDTEERPLELVGKTCDALFLEAKDNSGILNISITIRLIDCYNNIIFESEEGKTKIKDYKDGYQDALKRAFRSLSDKNYSYDNNLKNRKTGTVKSNDLRTINQTKEEKYPNKKVYKFGGKTYWLVNDRDGDYKLLSNSGNVNYATLSKADKGSYIFNSTSISGAAYFDAEGNLNVEYMDKDLDELQYMTFKEVNQ